MKKVIRKIAQSAFILFAFTIVSISFNANGIKIVNEASAAVSQTQVSNYLIANGYEIITLEPIYSLGSKSPLYWLSHTIKNGEHFWTKVYCNEYEILGHGDTPF